MKVYLMCALCLTLAGASRGQVATDGPTPPGLVVLGVSWSRKTSAQGPGRAADPPPFDASRATPEVGPRPPYSPPVAGGNPFPASGRLPYYYVYSVRLRNDGAKAIRAVAWEHVFIDPGSGRELSRYRLIDDEKVGRQKTVILSARLSKPPSNVVGVEGLGADGRSPFTERAAIKCVLYDDGSQWEVPEAKGAECDRLQRLRKVLR